MSERKLAPAALLAAAAFVASLPAQAYCLTHGCNIQTDQCRPDRHGCVTEGPLLHWKSGCVSVDLQQDGSPKRDISYEAAHDVLVQAFAQWLNADCGGGQPPSITVSDYGPVTCRSPEYNQDSPNANVVMFRDQDWPYKNAIDTLALTTLIFDAETGEIFDADIEVNTFTSAMTTGKVGQRDVDLHSVLTHEVGHFLGLSHSDVALSTMEPSYSPGLTEMATIEYDDQQGICAALPPDRKPETMSCDPRHGFSGECALTATSCTVSGASPPGRGGWANAAWLLLGLSSRLRRKRLRPSSRRP
ncbi:MAG TPA: matrixin family metalloprotease [Polyangiaceae bacterium]|nr:matrixin family metalloprotease [Polyangiaceae bacterium]